MRVWLGSIAGFTEVTEANLKRFDDAYLSLYPYLPPILRESLLGSDLHPRNRLGYGTLGQAMIERGYQYWGIDIADGPVSLMKYRLAMPVWIRDRTNRILPLPLRFRTIIRFVIISDAYIIYGQSIPSGSESTGLLKPAGKTVVMLYNRRSFRQVVHVPLIVAQK